jgi:hypothetical protein
MKAGMRSPGDVEIDETLVRSLLAEQHPDLAGLGLRRVIGGWGSALTGEYRPRFRGVAPGVQDVWEDAIAAPSWDGPPVWLHGDLHPAWGPAGRAAIDRVLASFGLG